MLAFFFATFVVNIILHTSQALLGKYLTFAFTFGKMNQYATVADYANLPIIRTKINQRA